MEPAMNRHERRAQAAIDRRTRSRCAPGECVHRGSDGACIHCLAPPATTNGIGANSVRAVRREGAYDPGPPDDTDREPAVSEDTGPWLALVTSAPAEWYSEPPPKRDWLLRDARHPKARGVFPLGKVGQLIAEGGAGKTMALCQLAVAVATGTRWLGAFEATKGRVLLVLGEEDVEEVWRRLHHGANVSQGPRPDPGAIEVLPLAGAICAMLERDERGNAAETAFLGWLRMYIQAGGFRLVVVDPLSRFAGPDAEKDNAAATRFMQALESCTAADRSILNAHHTNKLSRGPAGTLDGSSGRGSSAFVDGARWQCALAVERIKLDVAEEQAALGEVVTFAVTKSNYAAKPEPVILRRDTAHGGALLPLDEADLATVEGARRGAERHAVREASAIRAAGDRRDKEDTALGEMLSPGVELSERAILARLRSVLGRCSDAAGRDAIERSIAAGRIVTIPGPRRARLHRSSQ